MGQLAIPQVVLDLLESILECLICIDSSGWKNVIETESKVFGKVILILQNVYYFRFDFNISGMCWLLSSWLVLDSGQPVININLRIVQQHSPETNSIHVFKPTTIVKPGLWCHQSLERIRVSGC